MKKHEYKGLTLRRTSMYIIVGVLILVAAFMLIGIVVTSSSFYAINEDNVVRVEGELMESAEGAGFFTVSLEGESKVFTLWYRFGEIIGYADFVERVVAGDVIGLYALRSEYESATDAVDIYGVTIKDGVLYSLDEGMKANKDYLYANFVFVSAMFFLMFLLAVGLIIKILRLPRHNEIKLSRYLQGKREDVAPDKYKKADKLISLFFKSAYPIVFVAQLSLVDFIASDSLLRLWLWAYSVFAALLFALPFAKGAIKRKRIEAFAADLDLKEFKSFTPKGDSFEDLIMSANVALNEKTLCLGFDGLTGKDEGFSFEYDELDVYAEAFFKPVGDMMTVYVVVEFKDMKTFARRLSGEEDGGIIEIVEESGMFLMLALDQSLYNYLKLYSVEVKGLEDLIENRETYMKRNCRHSFCAELS